MVLIGDSTKEKQSCFCSLRSRLSPGELWSETPSALSSFSSEALPSSLPSLFIHPRVLWALGRGRGGQRAQRPG